MTHAITPANIDKREMANAAFGFGNERFAERRFGKTVVDRNAGTAVFHFAGRRRFERHAKIVQAAGAGETGVKRGIKNIATVEQKLFHVFDGETLQKIFRRHAGPARKETMKMKRTETGGGRELIEVRLISVMSIQKPDHVCDSFIIVHSEVCNRRASAATRFLLRFLMISEARDSVNSNE